MGGFSATLQDERKELFRLQRRCSIRMKEESLLLVVPNKIERARVAYEQVPVDARNGD